MTRIYEGARPKPAHIPLDEYDSDVELGLLKTGKEADVYLVERSGPAGSCLLAAKRYRPPEHRGFKNDAAYRAHRRVTGMVRDRGDRRMAMGGRNLQKAMDQRSSYGRKAIAEQWIATEHETLERLWEAGAPVPYPVGRLEDGILMEYVGDADAAAPRLAQAHLEPGEVAGIFDQVREALRAFARAGIVHADLSAYNALVWEGRLWIIDLPQAVPFLATNDATDFLHRDVVNICSWFVRKGLEIDPEEVFVEVVNELFDYQMEDLFFSHGT